MESRCHGVLSTGFSSMVTDIVYHGFGLNDLIRLDRVMDLTRSPFLGII